MANVLKHFPTKLLLAGILGVAGILPASADPGAIAPVWYSSSVDMSAGLATFTIQFDRRPDLYTVDEFFRQADNFQFWTDSEAPDAIARTYAALSGELPNTTQTVISSSEIPLINEMEFIRPQPDSYLGLRDPGGWGSIEGHGGFTLSADNILSFRVPLSTLQDTDGTFYYTFETYRYGDWGESDYSGASGATYWVSCVPEPGEALLLLAGVGALAPVLRRRSHRCRRRPG
ncbi:MAG: hypothetical protein ACXWC4_10980 [Telluria sp.]